MKALITDGQYIHTLSIVRYLRREGVYSYVVSNTKLSPALFSKYCEKGFIGPGPDNEEEFINFLKRVIRAAAPDILIPVGALSTEVIAKNRDELDSFIKIELADYENIKIALNKKKTHALARKLGIPHPKTIYPETFAEVERISYSLDYPVVIKSLFEGGRPAYPNNRKELLGKYYEICDDYNFEEDSLPMIQEYIDNICSYCFATLYQNGTCKRVFMYKHTRWYPVKGGNGVNSIACYNQQVKELGVKLLNSLNWHGVAEVEFKWDEKNKEFKLIEINPKFWASVEAALRAGVNFGYYLCEMAKGKELEYSEEYNRNLKFHFPSRELQHIKEKPSSIPEVILDTLNPKVKSNIWLSDFKPNFVELSYASASLLLPKKIRSRLKKILRGV